MNAPDLFIPLMGLWSYALLSCVVLAFKHSFKPESMSSTVRACSTMLHAGSTPLSSQHTELPCRTAVLTAADGWVSCCRMHMPPSLRLF